MSRIRQPFKPGGKFIVSKSFTFRSVKHIVGKDFPWRQLDCSVRKLRQLYEGRLLNNYYVDPDEAYEEDRLLSEDEVTPEVTEDEANVDTTDEPTGTDGATDNPDVIDNEPVIYDPDIHEIVNPERGRWYMNLDGVPQLELKAKEAKRLRKKHKPERINPKGIKE